MAGRRWSAGALGWRKTGAAGGCPRDGGLSSELRLFGPDRDFVRSVGGEGDGPGEFGFNPCANAAPLGEEA